MSINWKVRLRHRQFWLGLTGALGTFAVAVAGFSGHGDRAMDVSDAINTMAASVLTVLALLGIVIDPTTEGAEDSDQAMTYEEPKPKD